jgi:hypothetical protein
LNTDEAPWRQHLAALDTEIGAAGSRDEAVRRLADFA